MAAAVFALAAFEYAEAEQDLEAVPIDQRDWEWRHLHSRIVDALPTLTHLPRDYRTIEEEVRSTDPLPGCPARDKRAGLACLILAQEL